MEGVETLGEETEIKAVRLRDDDSITQATQPRFLLPTSFLPSGTHALQQNETAQPSGVLFSGVAALLGGHAVAPQWYFGSHAGIHSLNPINSSLSEVRMHNDCATSPQFRWHSSHQILCVRYIAPFTVFW